MGLAIRVTGDDAERGLHIQERMESNLKMALERAEVLSMFWHFYMLECFRLASFNSFSIACRRPINANKRA